MRQAMRRRIHTLYREMQNADFDPMTALRLARRKRYIKGRQSRRKKRSPSPVGWRHPNDIYRRTR